MTTTIQENQIKQEAEFSDKNLKGFKPILKVSIKDGVTLDRMKEAIGYDFRPL